MSLVKVIKAVFVFLLSLHLLIYFQCSQASLSSNEIYAKVDNIFSFSSYFVHQNWCLSLQGAFIIYENYREVPPLFKLLCESPVHCVWVSSQGKLLVCDMLS